MQAVLNDLGACTGHLKARNWGHPILNMAFHRVARGVVELMCHRVHEAGSVQNEHAMICCFLATHDPIPLLVSDMVQRLPADVASLLAPILRWVGGHGTPGDRWWHHWVPPLGQQSGWVQHASHPMVRQTPVD
jgi:hypothetical protein